MPEINIIFNKKVTKSKWYVFRKTMLSGYIEFVGNFETVRFPVNSGGWSKIVPLWTDALPEGIYNIFDYFNIPIYRATRQMLAQWKMFTGSQCIWWVRLNPLFRTNRDALMGHVDNDPPGTLGCAGFPRPDDENVRRYFLLFKDKLKISSLKVKYQFEGEVNAKP
jgi:hypothetical protein